MSKSKKPKVEVVVSAEGHGKDREWVVDIHIDDDAFEGHDWGRKSRIKAEANRIAAALGCSVRVEK